MKQITQEEVDIELEALIEMGLVKVVGVNDKGEKIYTTDTTNQH